MPTSDSRLYPSGSGAPVARPIKGTFVEFGSVKTQRTRVSTAQVIAGYTLLPALPGVKWQLFDMSLMAIGGAAGTATSVDVNGTRGGSAVKPLVVAIAALTQSTRVKAGAANAVILADGASFTPLDANKAVTLKSVGAALDTCTYIDATLTYVAVAQ